MGVQRRALRRPPVAPVRTLVTAGVALTAVLLLLALIGSIGGGGREQTAQVVVASAPIAGGTTITPEMVGVTAVPVSRVPAGAFSSTSEVVGRTTARPVVPGEPITASVLEAPSAQQGGTGEFPPGMQVVSVVAQEPDAVMGRVQRGDLVDILATFYTPVPVTRVLVRSAPVLSVSRMDVQASALVQPDQRQRGQGSGQTKLVVLTVLVPSDLVPEVVLGQHAGRVAVSVRPPQGGPFSGDGKEGVSVPQLVTSLVPREQESPRQDTQRPVREAVPPVPPVRTAPVPTLRQEEASRGESREPARRQDGQEQSAWVIVGQRGVREDPQSGREREDSTVAVEVIRGNAVSLEKVPVQGAAPSEASVVTRARSAQGQQGRPQGAVIVPVGVPPAGGQASDGR